MSSGSRDYRTLLAGGGTLITLLAGYADLWRGGETIAPLLLVAGYVIGVPATLLARRDDVT